MPKIIPEPEVIQVLRQYRLALIAREDQQIQRLAKSWLQIEIALQGDMALLALEINEAKLAGNIVTEQLLRRMARYKKLDNQMKGTILDYVKDAAVPDIEAEQLQYGLLAIQSASDAIRLSGALGVQFDRLPKDAVETYVGYLGDGTPLYRLLKEAYPASLDGIVKSILTDAAKGIGPNQMAFNMARSLGIGLERITLIARTEQLRVNRSVSAEQYRTSGLNGVMKRVATKDANVCMACLASDGEVIPLDRELEDHPRGRCIAVFQIRNTPTIRWETGLTWFQRQDEQLQQQMLGREKYQLWQDGVFNLKDLRKTSFDPVWGSSPRVATIKELVNG